MLILGELINKKWKRWSEKAGPGFFLAYNQLLDWRLTFLRLRLKTFYSNFLWCRKVCVQFIPERVLSWQGHLLFRPRLRWPLSPLLTPTLRPVWKFSSPEPPSHASTSPPRSGGLFGAPLPGSAAGDGGGSQLRRAVHHQNLKGWPWKIKSILKKQL